MNVGDKVRMLRGKEEGIVTRIIDQKLIEIEIEDGFQIPVLKTEVVPVAREEASYFRREEQAAQAAAAPIKKVVPGQQGYFLSYKPLNDRLLSVQLINNTGDTILYSIVEEKAGSFHSVVAGELKAYQAHKFSQADMQDFERWPIWHIRMLPHPSGKVEEMPAPIQQRIHPKAGSFFKSMRDTPVLNYKSYLIPLQAGKISMASVEQLQDRLRNSSEAPAASAPVRPPAIVDLHLEKLTDKPKNPTTTEILQLQLDTFEKSLDNAIATGMEEITFIHGVGNGVLRKEIHRRLSNLNSIAWFKDVQKEKWGFGATLVRLK